MLQQIVLTINYNKKNLNEASKATTERNLWFSPNT